MNALRRLSIAAFVVACAHLVFGAIVRITGSGMGCGDHWPKCHGEWFPPMNRPDLIIEISHRWLAAFLIVSMMSVLALAFSRRALPGVGGKGGVLRSAALAVALVVSAALLGAVTVKLGNPPFATVGHWTIAMSLVATAAVSVMRAGGFGAAQARVANVPGKTRRSSFAAAALALITVVMGGLTAKAEGAAVACLSFPLCGANPDVPRSAVHIQSTHRILAVLLIFHLLGVVIALRKRGAAPIIRRAATIAFSLGILQLLVAGAMIGMRLPPVLRSLHEATGVSIWIATFVFAYLSRLGLSADPSVASLPQDDKLSPSESVIPSNAVILSEAKDLHLALPTSRMHHSVAVIVARGADA
jgi:heme A synthase